MYEYYLFQAEDCIRDAQLFSGLGDVYKGQIKAKLTDRRHVDWQNYQAPAQRAQMGDRGCQALW